MHVLEKIPFFIYFCNGNHGERKTVGPCFSYTNYSVKSRKGTEAKQKHNLANFILIKIYTWQGLRIGNYVSTHMHSHLCACIRPWFVPQRKLTRLPHFVTAILISLFTLLKIFIIQAYISWSTNLDMGIFLLQNSIKEIKFRIKKLLNNSYIACECRRHILKTGPDPEIASPESVPLEVRWTIQYSCYMYTLSNESETRVCMHQDSWISCSKCSSNSIR